jgi:MoaD family protein
MLMPQKANSMNGCIKIKFLGILKKTYGGSEASLEMSSHAKLRDVVQKLAESSPALAHALVDAELKDPRPNAVILVNGREISALNGLETPVEAGDEVVFVPVVHGG